MFEKGHEWQLPKGNRLAQLKMFERSKSIAFPSTRPRYEWLSDASRPETTWTSGLQTSSNLNQTIEHQTCCHEANSKLHDFVAWQFCGKVDVNANETTSAWHDAVTSAASRQRPGQITTLLGSEGGPTEQGRRPSKHRAALVRAGLTLRAPKALEAIQEVYTGNGLREEIIYQ